MSSLDNLNALNDLVASKPTKTESKERPTMPVPPAVLKAFIRLVPALRIIKIAEARKGIEESIISDEMIGIYADILWNQGCRPVNPRLIVPTKEGRPDLSGLFQVQEKWKLNYEKGESPVTVRLEQALVKAGFDQSMAEKIVKEEINCQPLTVFKPLNDLKTGTPTEQAAADKLIALAMGKATFPLTAEERAVAITKIEVVEVKDGILERIKAYCKDAGQLKRLFKVITPVHFVSHAKFGESDTEEQRTQRLAAESQQLIMGTKMPDKK